MENKGPRYLLMKGGSQVCGGIKRIDTAKRIASLFECDFILDCKTGCTHHRVTFSRLFSFTGDAIRYDGDYQRANYTSCSYWVRTNTKEAT